MNGPIIIALSTDPEQTLAKALAEIALQHRLSDDDMIGLLIRQLAEWRKFGEQAI
jgi:hypothetical protein